ncbi:MAG: HAMP domain-containing sensor histidine kinase [Clostridia bacterium]|nr:HAMP domain-containing sensor histidine kinase [Clostridia bacterium]
MIPFLCGLCAALVVAVCLLGYKIAGMRRAAGEIRRQFSDRLDEDTNVGVDVSTGDRAMRALARDVDRALKRLREAELRYRQGDQELKDAITNISHDLRTPLTAICGYAALLRREELPPNARREAEIIAERADAMRRLTEELFRYSIAAATNADEMREPVVLNHALEECAAAHYGALTEAHIIPEIHLPDAPVTRLLNRSALLRVLGNAIGNAVKYSDGDLSIDLSEDGVIRFSNHASQLDEVAMGRLFDRFYTVESGGRGTGLGLSIARELTVQMGGTISAHLNEGVFTLTIRFPAPPEGASAAP